MNHTRTSLYSRWLLPVLILTLLFPLLAACGADSPASQVFPTVNRGISSDEELPPAEAQDPSLSGSTQEAPDSPVAGRAGADGEEDTAPSAVDVLPAPLPTPPATAPTSGFADTADGISPSNPSGGAAGALAPEDPDKSLSPASDSEELPPPPALAEPDIGGAPDRRSFQGAPVALKAGEVDDNAQFQGYLDYLASYQSGSVRLADVSERYFITVRDNEQQPLMDARVRIYDEQDQQIFEGLTYAGGQTLFLPRAVNVSDNVTRFRIVAERNGASAETTLARGTQEQVELAIADAQPPTTLRLDLLFLLDTTGSMADELARVQETIDSIAQRIDAFEPRPELRFGLVAYRDTGDEYVTRDYDFTPDVSAFRQVLNGFSANGGGDTPEALDEALHLSVSGVNWSEDAVRLVFLVADAGPHINADQALPYNYLTDTQQAVSRGIKIYPIAASNTDPQAEYVFRQLAQQTMGRFIFLTYQPGESSGAPGETTTLEAGEQQFTVERLDDLIVQIVERELARAVGAQ